MLPQGDFVLTNNRLSTQCERCGGWGCDWDDYRDYILAESGSSLFSRVVVRTSEIQGSVVEASETGCAGGRAIIEVWHQQPHHCRLLQRLLPRVANNKYSHCT